MSVDRYEYDRLTDLIGEGSFGKVFKGRCRQTGLEVALKFVQKQRLPLRTLQLLRTEITTHRRLTHRNIIEMVDSYETEDYLCIVTELAEGDLTKKFGELKRWRRIGEWGKIEYVIQEVARQLLNALGYLKKERIIHRDLKPANILTSDNLQLKLCDFGLSRAFSNEASVTSTRVGSPLWSAPEVLESERYTYKADLWSLGIVLYELYMGQTPFTAPCVVDLVASIRRNQVEYPPHMSDDLKSLLQGLLQQQPEERIGWDELLRHPFLHPGGNRRASSTQSADALISALRNAQPPENGAQWLLHASLAEHIRMAGELLQISEDEDMQAALTEALASLSGTAVSVYPPAHEVALAAMEAVRLAVSVSRQTAGRVRVPSGSTIAMYCTILRALLPGRSSPQEASWSCLEVAATGISEVLANAHASFAGSTGDTDIRRMIQQAEMTLSRALDKELPHLLCQMLENANLVRLKGAKRAALGAMAGLFGGLLGRPQTPTANGSGSIVSAYFPLALALSPDLTLQGMSSEGMQASCRFTQRAAAQLGEGLVVFPMALGSILTAVNRGAFTAPQAGGDAEQSPDTSSRSARTMGALRVLLHALRGSEMLSATLFANDGVPMLCAVATGARQEGSSEGTALALLTLTALVDGAANLLKGSSSQQQALGGIAVVHMVGRQLEILTTLLQLTPGRALVGSESSDPCIPFAAASAIAALLSIRHLLVQGLGEGEGRQMPVMPLPTVWFITLTEMLRFVPSGEGPAFERVEGPLCRTGLFDGAVAMANSLSLLGYDLDPSFQREAVGLRRELVLFFAGASFKGQLQDMSPAGVHALLKSLNATQGEGRREHPIQEQRDSLSTLLTLLGSTHCKALSAWPPAMDGGPMVLLTASHASLRLLLPFIKSRVAVSQTNDQDKILYRANVCQMLVSQMTEYGFVEATESASTSSMAVSTISLALKTLSLLIRRHSLFAKQYMAAGGLAAPLLHQMLLPTGPATLLGDMLQVLALVAQFNRDLYTHIRDAAIFSQVKILLAHQDARVRGQACVLLQNMGLFSDFFYSDFLDHDLVPVLIQRCMDGDSSISSSACSALGNAGKHSTLLHESLQSAISPLLTLLCSNIEGPEPLVSAARTLGVLGSNSTGLCQSLLSARAHRTLLRLASRPLATGGAMNDRAGSSDGSVQRAVLHALGSMCTRRMWRDALLELDVQGMMSRLLNSHDPALLDEVENLRTALEAATL